MAAITKYLLHCDWHIQLFSRKGSASAAFFFQKIKNIYKKVVNHCFFKKKNIRSYNLLPGWCQWCGYIAVTRSKKENNNGADVSKVVRQSSSTWSVTPGLFLLSSGERKNVISNWGHFRKQKKREEKYFFVACLSSVFKWNSSSSPSVCPAPLVSCSRIIKWQLRLAVDWTVCSTYYCSSNDYWDPAAATYY